MSGAMMIGQTNDDFVGVDAVRVYDLDKPLTLDLLPMQAGTVVHHEDKTFLRALGGLGREARDGVVGPHTGLQPGGRGPGGLALRSEAADRARDDHAGGRAERVIRGFSFGGRSPLGRSGRRGSAPAASMTTPPSPARASGRSHRYNCFRTRWRSVEIAAGFDDQRCCSRTDR